MSVGRSSRRLEQCSERDNGIVLFFQVIRAMRVPRGTSSAQRLLHLDETMTSSGLSRYLKQSPDFAFALAASLDMPFP